MTQLETIQQDFRTLRMPTAVQIVAETVAVAQKENWSLETFLAEILEQEMEGRRQRRIQRLKKASYLPVEKTLATSDQERLPLRVRRLLPHLYRQICRSCRESAGLRFARQRKDTICCSRGPRTRKPRAHCYLHPNLPSC